MESSLRERLEKIVEHAASKTPCGEHYRCLLADLKMLLKLIVPKDTPMLEYKPDPNNGAGLWAVFLYGTSIHHFREGTDATAYMDRIRKAYEEKEVGEGLREELQAIWNLVRESEYSRIGKLPSNEWLNSTVQWWMTHSKELKDYDKPDFSWAALAAPAPKPAPPAESKVKVPNLRAFDRAAKGDFSLFSERHCCVCGKEIKDTAEADWILLTRAEDGAFESAILHPSDATDGERKAGLWVAPIGADCLRKNLTLKPFALRRAAERKP